MATFKCPMCKKKYIAKPPLYEHIESAHSDECHGLTGKHIYFNFTNRYALTKGFGKSIISNKPTPFNEITGRYERFLPEEKEAYREYFKANMRKAGKENIMKDMEHQKMMLAARGISGKYKWTDGTEFTYTGSYEKKFLEYLDLILGWPSSDLMGPAPQIFPYKNPVTNDERAHIPDFYISSLNLIINVKSSENKHYRLRDIDVERAQDSAIKASTFNYLKLYDNNFSKFTDIINKLQESENPKEARIFLESSDF